MMASHADTVALATHMEWADALVWSTVLQSGPARQDPRVRTWLHHIHTVQRVFVGAWHGRPLQLVDASTFPDLPALGAWGREGHASIRAALAGMDAAGLACLVEMPWAARFSQLPPAQVNHPTLEQTVVHLALHSAHHRGQLNVCLRELGAEPPLLDFVAWLWRSSPPPMWPRNIAAPPATAPDRVASEHD